MTLTRRIAILLGLLTAAPWSVKAQVTTLTVSFAVNPINVIAFTGNPALAITTAVPGNNPTTVMNSTARWAVTTNQTGAKITASIPVNVPAGLTLSVNLAAPTGGTSLGYKTLSTVGVDLVTGITKRNQANQVVNYRLAAIPTAAIVPLTTRVVTYTLTGGT
jgi:hypothetical protein